MHNNYYFLRQLSTALGQRLVPSVISECFSQNKDELILRFETSDKPFFIRASLDPSFSCLSFPSEFHRARKNSIDLFADIIGRRVMSVQQYRNERCFALMLSDGFSLLFKLHGGRSNLLLFQNDSVVELFRNNLDADKSILLDSLHRDIDFSRDAFLKNIDRLPQLYFTFGQVVWSYLESIDFDSKSIDEKWIHIQQLIAILNDPEFFIVEDQKRGVFLSLVKFGDVLNSFTEPLVAINDFVSKHNHLKGFAGKKEQLLSQLRSSVKAGESYLQKTESKLLEIEQSNHYKTWADLIMANMHLIIPGCEKITLPDFESGKPVDIRLKPDLSPQRNAELFYRKAKNQHIEIEHIVTSIDKKKKELEALNNRIMTIEGAVSIQELPQSWARAKDQKEKNIQLPYNEVEYKGFRIWIGRNAEANDLLTLKHTYKEDLWLHAKDVAGSHVVIKHQSGKKFPKDVIEAAASLAAYNSKRKNESLCPVIVTPKKYVRKRKGDPAGAVVVDREDVILVPPGKVIS